MKKFKGAVRKLKKKERKYTTVQIQVAIRDLASKMAEKQKTSLSGLISYLICEAENFEIDWDQARELYPQTKMLSRIRWREMENRIVDYLVRGSTTSIQALIDWGLEEERGYSEKQIRYVLKTMDELRCIELKSSSFGVISLDRLKRYVALQEERYLKRKGKKIKEKKLK